MAKGIGYGSALAVGSGTGVAIGAVVDGFDNECTREEVDTTLLADAWKSNAPADGDGGELSFDVALGGDGDSTLQTLYGAGTVENWTITYSNGGTDTFSGWIKSLGRTVSKRDMITRKVTVRITGNPGI